MISGTTTVTAPIAPTSIIDLYPTHDATYGLDGFRNVSTLSDRNNIPNLRRRAGMVVGIISDSTYWRLKDIVWDGTNNDWEAFILGTTNIFVNGLTSSAGIVKLGGTLIENTTINLSSYRLNMQYGTFEVSGTSIISGTSGNGYLSLLSQTSSVINTTSSVNLYSNSTNDLSWISNSYSKTLSATNSTANRIYALQDKSGTLAHLDDIFPDTTTTELTPVISILNTPAVSPLDGDRYLIGTASTGIWATYSNYTVQYDDTLPDWVYTAPLIDNVVYVTNTLTTYRYNGTSWVNYMGTAILQNGNTLGGSVNIGTKDNFNIYFKTNNINRVFVTPANFVGMGVNQFPITNIFLKIGGVDGQTNISAGGDGFVTFGKIGATKQWGFSLNSVGQALTTANATLYASSVGVNTSASWGLGTTLNAVSTTSRGSIILANAGTGNVLFRADSVRFTPIASANTAGALSILGVNTSFEFISPAHTNQDAGVETIAFDNNFSNSIQHQTGTMSLQRDWVLRPRTHRFIGASVITNAYSMWIGGEPIAGTNATITNSWALGVTGKSQLSGNIFSTNTYADLSHSATASFLGIDSTGKLFNTNISSATSLLNGTGTLNYISKFTGTQSLGNSLLYDNGSSIGIGSASLAAKFNVTGSDNTSSNYALAVLNASASTLLSIRNDGFTNFNDGDLVIKKNGFNTNIDVPNYKTLMFSMSGSYGDFMSFSHNVGNIAMYRNLTIYGQANPSGNCTVEIGVSSGDSSLGVKNISFVSSSSGLGMMAIGSQNSITTYGTPMVRFTYDPVSFGGLVTDYANNYHRVGMGVNPVTTHRVNISDGLKVNGGTSSNYVLSVVSTTAAELFNVNNNGYVGIGTGSPSASLHIVGLGASPSMTMLSLTNPYQTIFNVYDDGNLYSPSTYNITTSSPTASFLGIDNTGKLFNTSISTSTIVSGSGSINYISKFTGTYSLGNSLIYDDGTNIGIGTQSDGIHRVSINGDVNIQGTLYATSKSFEIKHPLEEGKRLVYGSLEGPEYGIYHRGKLENTNVIDLPDYWTKLVDETTITVNITPIGKYQKIYVDKILDNKIYLSKNTFFNKKNITCYYIIYAERNDIPKIKLIK